MRISIYGRAVLAVAAVIWSSAAASAQYKFVKLKVPMSGAKDTAPAAISNQNEIVGTFREPKDAFHPTLGFLRTNDTPAQWIYISDPDGNQRFTQANGVNSSRMVVGDYEVSSSIIEGMFYDSGGYSTYSLSGCKRTYINGINDNGDLTGDCQEGGSYEGWYRIGSSSTPTFFVVPGSTNTYTTAINSEDTVVGWYYQGNNHGYMRTSTGEVTSIDYPGAVATWVFGISAPTGTGDVLLSGNYEDSNGVFHGYIYDAGSFTLIDAPGATSTAVTAINKNGWFVGAYQVGNKSYAYYAKPSAGPNTLVDEP
jgi:hypothetical protein